MTHAIRTIALAFFALLATSSAQEKADGDSSALFQLCPVTTKENPDRRGYAFKHALKKTNSENFSSGWYHPEPVLDFHDVKSVEIDIVEMAAAPFRGIVFSFTDRGYKKLEEYLKGDEPPELLLTLDGHNYSILAIDTLRGTVKAKGKIIVFIAEPYSNVGNHLITLLVDKLRAHLPKSKGESGRRRD